LAHYGGFAYIFVYSQLRLCNHFLGAVVTDSFVAPVPAPMRPGTVSDFQQDGTYMAKVTVVPVERATTPAPLPAGLVGAASTATYLAGPKNPLQLHQLTIAPGDSIAFAPLDVDRLVYILDGLVTAGSRRLEAGSSLVVEHGATMSLSATAQDARLLIFSAADSPAHQRAGGQVHLLPADHVVRFHDMIPGVHGAMHFDSACPTCELWLHESEFTASFLTPQTANRGAHCHTEDEIIFVTAGSAMLGNRAYGPGTAIAVHAETMYSFNPGPEGLRFINFRAARPEINRRSDGTESREADGWAQRMDGRRPAYLHLQ
jgi:quercetin dioxygenase-like cupin family protein